MRVISLGKIIVAAAGTPVSVGSTVATVIGTEVSTFAIVLNVSNKLLLNVDGGADQTVTLTAGASRTAAQVVSDINSGTTGITAFVTGGKIALSSNTSGSGSSVTIQDVTHTANAVLGFTPGTSTGADDVICAKLRLTALKANAGDVYVGTAGFDKSTGVGLIMEISKPLANPATLDSFVVDSQEDADIIHTKHYFVDADTDNDGVLAVIWVV